MKLFILFAVYASAFCVPLDRPTASIGGMTPSDPIRGLIVGGQETTIEAFPWIVSLQRLGDHFCGGSIISTTRILSAAHCTFFGSAETLFIRAGTTNNRVGGQLVVASQIINHPEYELQTSNNDISIVILSSPLDTSPAGVAIVALPPQDAGVAVGATSYVAGWGFLCEGCEGGTNVLNYVAVPVISNAQCSTLYNRITAGMLCAGFPEGGRDACDGDSGGPLTFNNLLIGVVSWGTGCARPNLPGVYARVAHYRNWIDGHL